MQWFMKKDDNSNSATTSARSLKFVLPLLARSLHNVALSPCDVFMLSVFRI